MNHGTGRRGHADPHLDDLIATLARALARTRQSCAQAHLQRLQARLYRGQALCVQHWQDGRWQAMDVPLHELVAPGRILASTLEVQIDCDVEEAEPDQDGQPPALALLPTHRDAPHRLTIVLYGGNPLRGELLLDGQLLRPLLIDPITGREA
ncbi:hypothetical protein JY452_08105 [Stenotrophomonas maltophilia]|uniref:hypothetical protein n=1 Tax=Stenotrophomonas TaxID=40323 RepID=UPI0006C32420|nr:MULTISPECIES: hypothetical protein [Stenotrophomonas]KAA3601964.1 hypothetical protein D1178_07830 [Stenotrophomonas maltophilia]KOO80892.1 hypothetical protein VO93_21135 [Stenotrophomonas maltophilia]MBN5125955.1 hypothetical protein [Stenotrophomonas maltophilia]MBN5176279.1 hypothetical protein [Stenotrophomonas maltophilia]MCU1121403.1 hypothetical protein [Stenotrophomonas maltophilia]